MNNNIANKVIAEGEKVSGTVLGLSPGYKSGVT